MKEVFNSFHNFKSPGIDQIPPQALKNLGDATIERIVRLYKASYLLGYVPNRWLAANVKFLPKPGKDTYDVPTSFRPISLMSYLHKALEKLFLWRLEETVFANKPIHHNQHGFRPGYSCESALTNVVSQVEHTFLQGEQGIGIFCDLVGAFDAVTYKSILQSFRKRGFDPLFIEWYSYYLYNRFVTIDLKGVQVTRRCTRGVPQGGVLSPLAFNCATEDGLNLFEDDAPTPDTFRPPATAAERAKRNRKVKTTSKTTKRKRPLVNTAPTQPPRVTVSTTAFADDLCFYITGGPIGDLQKKAQSVMDKASAWSKTKGMQFSSSKTVALIFSRVKYKTPPQLILNGIPLPYSPLAKYLGVYLDTKLTWRDHVDIKIKKAKKTLMSIVRVCHPTWGISPLAAAYYWKQCILPMFTYGCLVWHRVCRYKGIQRQLKSFQRLALKMMGPLRHSTPTRGLEVINYFRPIELETRRLAAEAYLRTEERLLVPAASLQTKELPLKGHRQWCFEYLEYLRYPYLGKPSDACIRQWMWQKSYKVDLESTKSTCPYYGQPKSDAFFTIFTDGSIQRNPNNRFETQAGGGLYICGGTYTQSNKLGKHVTIFQAEMHSIRRGALWLLEHYRELEGYNVCIYTDSLASLLALKKPFTKSKLVLSTMKLLNRAATKCNNLWLRWVKSHSNVVYNDKADELAVAAAANPNEGDIVEDLPLLAPELAKRQILTATDHLWNVLFKALRYPEECRQTKQWFPTVDKARSRKILSCNRSQWGKLNQFMTGHNHLGRHSNIVDPTSNPICSLCDFGYVQDTQHIIAECPYFLGLRSDIFNEYVIVPPFDHLPIGKVLQFLHQSELDALVWEV